MIAVFRHVNHVMLLARPRLLRPAIILQIINVVIIRVQAAQLELYQIVNHVIHQFSERIPRQVENASVKQGIK